MMEEESLGTNISIGEADGRVSVAKDIYGNYVYYVDDQFSQQQDAATSSTNEKNLNSSAEKGDPGTQINSENLISISPEKNMNISPGSGKVLNIETSKILYRFDPETVQSLNQILDCVEPIPQSNVSTESSITVPQPLTVVSQLSEQNSMENDAVNIQGQINVNFDPQYPSLQELPLAPDSNVNVPVNSNINVPVQASGVEIEVQTSVPNSHDHLFTTDKTSIISTIPENLGQQSAPISVKKNVSTFLPDFLGYPVNCNCSAEDVGKEIPIEQIWIHSNQMYFLPQIAVLVICNEELVGFVRAKKYFLSVGEIIKHLLPNLKSEVENYLTKNLCEKDFLSLEELAYLEQRNCIDINSDTMISLSSLRTMCTTILCQILYSQSSRTNLQEVANGIYYYKHMRNHIRCSKCGGVIRMQNLPDAYLELDRPPTKNTNTLQNQVERNANTKVVEKQDAFVPETQPSNCEQNPLIKIQVGHIDVCGLHFQVFSLENNIFISLKQLVEFRVTSLHTLQKRLLNLQYRPRPAPTTVDVYFLNENLNLDNTLWIDMVTVRCMCCMGPVSLKGFNRDVHKCLSRGHYTCSLHTELQGYDDCNLEGIVYTLNPCDNKISNLKALKDKIQSLPPRNLSEIDKNLPKKNRVQYGSDRRLRKGRKPVMSYREVTRMLKTSEFGHNTTAPGSVPRAPGSTVAEASRVPGSSRVVLGSSTMAAESVTGAPQSVTMTPASLAGAVPGSVPMHNKDTPLNIKGDQLSPGLYYFSSKETVMKFLQNVSLPKNASITKISAPVSPHKLKKISPQDKCLSNNINGGHFSQFTVAEFQDEIGKSSAVDLVKNKKANKQEIHLNTENIQLEGEEISCNESGVGTQYSTDGGKTRGLMFDTVKSSDGQGPYCGKSATSTTNTMGMPGNIAEMSASELPVNSGSELPVNTCGELSVTTHSEMLINSTVTNATNSSSLQSMLLFNSEITNLDPANECAAGMLFNGSLSMTHLSHDDKAAETVSGTRNFTGMCDDRNFKHTHLTNGQDSQQLVESNWHNNCKVTKPVTQKNVLTISNVCFPRQPKGLKEMDSFCSTGPSSVCDIQQRLTDKIPNEEHFPKKATTSPGFEGEECSFDMQTSLLLDSSHLNEILHENEDGASILVGKKESLLEKICRETIGECVFEENSSVKLNAESGNEVEENRKSASNDTLCVNTAETEQYNITTSESENVCSQTENIPKSKVTFPEQLLVTLDMSAYDSVGKGDKNDTLKDRQNATLITETNSADNQNKNSPEKYHKPEKESPKKKSIPTTSQRNIVTCSPPSLESASKTYMIKHTEPLMKLNISPKVNKADVTLVTISHDSGETHTVNLNEMDEGSSSVVTSISPDVIGSVIHKTDSIVQNSEEYSPNESKMELDLSPDHDIRSSVHVKGHTPSEKCSSADRKKHKNARVTSHDSHKQKKQHNVHQKLVSSASEVVHNGKEEKEKLEEGNSLTNTFTVGEREMDTKVGNVQELIQKLQNFVKNLAQYIDVDDFSPGTDFVKSKLTFKDGAKKVFPGLFGDGSYPMKKRFTAILTRLLYRIYLQQNDVKGESEKRTIDTAHKRESETKPCCNLIVANNSCSKTQLSSDSNKYSDHLTSELQNSRKTKKRKWRSMKNTCSDSRAQKILRK